MAVHPQFIRITGGIPIQHSMATPHPILISPNIENFPSFPNTIFHTSSFVQDSECPDTWAPGARSALQAFTDILINIQTINPPTPALAFLMYIWASPYTQKHMTHDPRLARDDWARFCGLIRDVYTSFPKIQPPAAYEQYVRIRNLLENQPVDDQSRASVWHRFQLLVDAACENPLHSILTPMPLYVTIICNTILKHIVRAHSIIDALEEYNTKAIRCLHDVRFLLEMMADMPEHHSNASVHRQLKLAIDATQESLTRASTRICDLGALTQFAEALHSVFGNTQQEHVFETTHQPTVTNQLEQLD